MMRARGGRRPSAGDARACLAHPAAAQVRAALLVSGCAHAYPLTRQLDDLTAAICKPVPNAPAFHVSTAF